MIQLGDGEAEEKPQFASLLKGQSISTITLDEALKLFAFPKVIGDSRGRTSPWPSGASAPT